MKPYIHLLTSLALATILYPFVGLHSLWVVFGGVLIDVDHWFWTMGRFKWISLSFSYDYHEDRHLTNYQTDILHIFHTIEVWALIAIVAGIAYFLNQMFIFYMFGLILVGMILHVLLDFISLIRHNQLNARAISLIGWLKRNN